MGISLVRMGLILFGTIVISFAVGLFPNNTCSADEPATKPSLLDYTIGMSTSFDETNSDEMLSAILGSVGLAGKSGTDTARAALTINGNDLELSSDMKMRRIYAMMGSVTISGEGRLNIGSEHNGGRLLGGLGYLEAQVSLGNLLGYGRLSAISDVYGSNLMDDLRRVSNVGLLTKAYLDRYSGYTTLGLGGRYRLSEKLTLLGDTDLSRDKNGKVYPRLGTGIKLSETLPGVLTSQLFISSVDSRPLELNTEYIQYLTETARLTAQTTVSAGNQNISLPLYSLAVNNNAENWDIEGKFAGGFYGSHPVLKTLGAEFGIRSPGEVRFFIEYEFDVKMMTIGGRTRF